ncbi:MAG: flagellar hook-length control protein FliK [Lachnospiraceae bacterium]|nr:flagellar hook-length control protein FliK [Lachnospiraceae bacterium]
MDIQRVYNTVQSLKNQKPDTGAANTQNQTTGAEKAGTQQAVQGSSAKVFGLMPGQVVAGNITDIRGSLVEIMLSNNQSVTARLTENFEYVIGQRAMFTVKSNDGQQIVLVPKDRTSMEQAGNLVLARILGEAGVEVSEKNLELIKSMMKEQIPVDAQTVQKYAKELALFPQADADTIVGLEKYQIPLNEEMVTQYGNYKNNEYQILEQTSAMPDEMLHLFSEMAEEDTEDAVMLWNDVMDALELTVAEKGQGSVNPLSEEQKQELLLLFGEELEGGEEIEREIDPEQRELLHLIESEESAPEEILKKLQTVVAHKSMSKEHLGSLFRNDGLRTLLHSALNDKMLLDPRMLEEERAVSNFYQKLMERTQKAQKVMEEYGKGESALAKTTSEVNGNVKFMGAMNEMLNYVQLPLKFTEENGHGDLYVYTKKNLLRKKGEELTALLHLELETLGNVDVFIRMTDLRVNTDFTLESEEMLEFVGDHIEELNERLNRKGYQMSSTVQLKKKTEKGVQKESKPDFFQDIVNRDKKTVKLTRFSFDVRA